MKERFSSPSLIVLLKCLFAAMSVFMIYTAVETSLRSNLFKEWNTLAAIPWMNATLIDFYFNITIISVWVIYKEKTLVMALLWIVLFVLLGSITTCFYVFLQLSRLKPGESITQVLLRAQ